MGHAAVTMRPGERRTFREVVTFTAEQQAARRAAVQRSLRQFLELMPFHLRLGLLAGAISPTPLGSIDWRKHRRRGWKQRRSAGLDRRR